ncbi:MAG TPA: intein-containing Rv2578c family radical SAM protein [Acidimicrobiales bacterium]|jgi:DNA repair photolyase|nr:intein-containing Rv2578c family radical SAM protein [Acidimicrobiales bacterium]
MRWKLADAEDAAGQGALFAEEEIVDRHVGTGEYRGLEFYEVRSRSIINEVPGVQRLPFRWTINPYRGCSHSCVYCMGPDTPVLMADGTHRPIKDVRRGDKVYGTERVERYRKYVVTEVLAHWETVKRAFRVTLEDGTSLIASGDHRFLTGRGWKFVSGTGCGAEQRPHLTTTNHLLGTGAFAEQPKVDDEYRRGYLSGMVRGDGSIGHREYRRPSGASWVQHQFRLALVDVKALDRTRLFLQRLGVEVDTFRFAPATADRREIWGIRCQRRASVELVERLIAFPLAPSDSWLKGFVAGFFDAEGSCSGGVLRMSNTDPKLLARVAEALERFGFAYVVEPGRVGQNRVVIPIRITGGAVERLRFFHTFDPAITRKRNIDGNRIKNSAPLRVVSVEDLGLEIPMYDITTGTGDFIADGVVSHNCFARPTHDYLGFDIGRDFDSKIVVKVNAVERLRSELAARRWAGDHIAMGTNTDPYQRCEGKYHLTQGIVRTLGEFANPFSILTKSTLILRDLPLLVEAAKRTDVRINFSIGTLDERAWKSTEPGTPHPKRRVEAVRRINDAGIPCGVLVAPVIPGISDATEQVEEVVRACAEAGAVSISAMPLHLRKGVKEHWMGWLKEAHPDLVPLYAKTYKGAYAPKAVSESLQETVRRVLAETRAHRPQPWLPRQEPSQRAVPKEPADVPVQQALL